jgi:hypothetical protein
LASLRYNSLENAQGVFLWPELIKLTTASFLALAKLVKAVAGNDFLIEMFPLLNLFNSVTK